MLKYLVVAITSFSISLLLLFLFTSRNEIGCFPYLETVFKLQRIYTKKLVKLHANPLVVKELDLKLELLNEKIKNSQKFLLDCSFCLGCKKEKLN